MTLRPARIFSFTPHRVCLSAALAVGLAGQAFADAPAPTLDLAQQPMYTTAQVPPNVLFTLDDSASMARTSTGLLWPCKDQRLLSYQFNDLAYNPNIVYLPPLRTLAGDREADANFHAQSPYSGLTIDLATDFMPYDPEILGSDYFMCDPEWDPALGRPVPRVKPERAYYYQLNSTASVSDIAGFGGGDPRLANYFTKVTINRTTADERNFANWFRYYRSRLNTVKSVVRDVVAEQDPGSLRLTWTAINLPNLTTASRLPPDNPFLPEGWIPPIAPLDQSRFSSFTDWLGRVSENGNTPLRFSMMRAHKYFSQNGSLNPYQTLPGVDTTELACRQNFNIILTDGADTTGTGPVRIVGAWQIGDADNTATTLPTPSPALSNAPNPGRYDPGASDSKVYSANNDAGTQGDVTFLSWATDLRPDLDNLVPPRMVDPRTDASSPLWNPRNDPATWQHISTFGIGVAVNTTLPVTDATVDKLRSGAATLDTGRFVAVEGGGSSRQNIDPFWHAMLNGRGQLFVSNSPEAIKAAFRDIFASISQSSGSGGGVSLSSASVRAGEISYTTGFTSGVWSGSLLARENNEDGSLGKTLWDAACVLTGGYCATTKATLGEPSPKPSERVILSTSAPTTDKDKAIAFRWDRLSRTQRNNLSIHPPTGAAPDNLGKLRVDWLRGDRAQEATTASPRLRPRASVLGDIVRSQAVVLGRPLSGYRDQWPEGAPEQASKYSEFAKAHKDRQTLLFVGANDGMLHAFDTDGRERFAYVPNGVYPQLAGLTDRGYNHHAFVDATPTVRDAMVGNTWRTVLVGGLGAGGKGLYALDVTDTSAIDETNSNLMWDITGDSRQLAMGHIYGPITVARLADGHWWAITGNGYNSPRGLPALVLVRLDGKNVLTLETDKVAAPIAAEHRANGLGAVTVSDFNSDTIAEYAYAGDLYGNVWKFDLTGKSPSSWRVHQASMKPFFEASRDHDRPITAAPRLGRARDGTVIVVVGTGKELEKGDDKADAHRDQVIYGLFDDGRKTSIHAEDLVMQTATAETVGGRTIRRISDNPVPTRSGGWMLALPEDGEHVTLPAILRSQIALVPTTVPLSANPCLSGAKGWLMSLDLRTGRVPLAEDANGNYAPSPYFDINRDGKIDGADLQRSGIGGIAFGDAITGVTVSVDAFENDKIFVGLPGDDPGIETGAGFPGQRTSWRELTRQPQ